MTPGLIAKLYRAIGGTPGFIDQLRNDLRTADVDELLEELEGGEPGLLGAAREAYCQEILASRLYEALAPEARVAASRLALSELPLPVDAVALLTGNDQAQAGLALEAGVSYGLVQRFDEPDSPPLYHPPALLRPWLSTTEGLSGSDTCVLHGHIAAFWRARYEAQRVSELRAPVDIGLAACREHAQRGGDAVTLQWATLGLARILSLRSEWWRARELLEEIPFMEREAGAWHQLAIIERNQGNYTAACEKFQRALQINQDIGDRAGEAAAFHQLGILAHRIGYSHGGARLIAVSWRINQEIGHIDAERAFQNLSELLRELGYDQARFDAMLKEADEGYQQDRGWSLIARAFATPGSE